MTRQMLVRSRSVEAARQSNAPVVALESTIITHGLPYPRNLETALAVEASVRDAGAVPATVAILGGQIRIGLSEAELSALARAERPRKVSRADFAATVALGETGSTTVAATMIAAHMAGIAVFATGGIGGVHHGAETSFDISADLDELARTPVIVVSAGAKAILDLGKTLEVLETRGVPVIGYGTDAFPAFWSADSGLKVPVRADSAAAIAAIHQVQRAAGLGGGLLVANPVPAEAAIAPGDMDCWIAQAWREAAEAGVAGKAVTPFLLSRIAVLSGGKSVETNVALVRNNARLGAEIAIALAASCAGAPES